mgnify:CR=1 FL=1
MSHINTVHLSKTPNILALLSRAALPKRASEGAISQWSVNLKGVKADAHLLRQYSNVCGFTSKSHMPASFPHIMAFPLHMKLLTDPTFPLPLLGLVHVKNHITQHRQHDFNEIFDIEEEQADKILNSGANNKRKENY